MLNMVRHVHCMNRAIVKLRFVVMNLDLGTCAIEEESARISSVEKGMALVQLFIRHNTALRKLVIAMEKTNPSHLFFLSLFTKYESFIAESIRKLDKAANMTIESIRLYYKAVGTNSMAAPEYK